jgi:hypothetical protein
MLWEQYRSFMSKFYRFNGADKLLFLILYKWTDVINYLSYVF